VPRIKRDDGKVKMILPPFAGELNGFTLLFEALAYYLWEKKVQVLPIDDLNDWYQDWLQQHQGVQAQYQI
jgi:hypothetical protein